MSSRKPTPLNFLLTISLIKVNTKLHNEIHFISLKNAEMTELLNAETTKAAELTNKHEDSEYELSKVKIKIKDRSGSDKRRYLQFS